MPAFQATSLAEKDQLSSDSGGACMQMASEKAHAMRRTESPASFHMSQLSYLHMLPHVISTPSQDSRSMVHCWLVAFRHFMFLPRCHKQLIGTHGNQYDSGEEYHTGSGQKFQSRRDLESWEHMGSFLVTLLPAASIQGCKTGEMENHVKRSACHVSRMYNWNLYCHIAPLCVSPETMKSK